MTPWAAGLCTCAEAWLGWLVRAMPCCTLMSLTLMLCPVSCWGPGAWQLADQSAGMRSWSRRSCKVYLCMGCMSPYRSSSPPNVALDRRSSPWGCVSVMPCQGG